MKGNWGVIDLRQGKTAGSECYNNMYGILTGRKLFIAAG
jgi:hypothetical protein